MKQYSDTALSELNEMMNDINVTLDVYCHVSTHLPVKIKIALRSFKMKITDEMDRRDEDQHENETR